MTYYYPNRETAQAEADAIALADDRIAATKCELVENNGWVIVAFPKVIDITDLAARVEVRHPAGHRLTPSPSEKRQPSSRVQAAALAQDAGAAGVVVPRTGSTARVHVIADQLLASGAFKSKADRGAIIAACVAEGINPATAGTQYSRWIRAKGL